MSSIKPIGVYDSGVGGLTVAREIFSQMPGESIIYFGDTAHVPYGDRSVEELLKFADNIIRFLIGQGAKMVVAACNTTSSVAIDKIKDRYPVPVVGVIRPGARAARLSTRNKKIGVIATQATCRSEAYIKAIKELDSTIEVYSQPCPRFVPLVEAGKLDTPETRAAAEEYIKPLMQAGVDTLVYGCTHYPFLERAIKRVTGDEVHLVDPASETVRETYEILKSKGLLAEGKTPAHRFYCSGSPESFLEVGRMFIPEIAEIKQITLN